MIVERIVDNETRLCIEGPMSMDSVAAVLGEAVPRVQAADSILDLAAVTIADSAALAAVLSLLRVARAAGHKLALRNAPAAFESLASLYGIEDILSEHLSTTAHDTH